MSAPLKEYNAFVETFVEICKRRLGASILSLGLLGSVGRGDVIPGYSDVDIFIVPRDGLYNSAGRIDRHFASELDRITQRVRCMYPRIPFTGVFRFRKDTFLRQVKGWRESARTLYGVNLADRLPAPQAELLRGLAVREISRSIAVLRRAPFQPPSPGNPYPQREVIRSIFNMAREALMLRGIRAYRKETMMREFGRVYGDAVFHDLPVRAHEFASDFDRHKHDRQALLGLIREAQPLMDELAPKLRPLPRSGDGLERGSTDRNRSGHARLEKS
ncbi:MAG: nucleotidyltransferase domain-containing protein [Candidatus Bathyarchaeia archaeon]